MSRSEDRKLRKVERDQVRKLGNLEKVSFQTCLQISLRQRHLQSHFWVLQVSVNRRYLSQMCSWIMFATQKSALEFTWAYAANGISPNLDYSKLNSPTFSHSVEPEENKLFTYHSFYQRSLLFFFEKKSLHKRTRHGPIVS